MLKKLFLLVLLIPIMLLYGFTSPKINIYKTLVNETKDDERITQIINFIDQGNYEDAINLFDNLSDKSKMFLLSNKDKLGYLLSHYKQNLINKISKTNIDIKSSEIKDKINSEPIIKLKNSFYNKNKENYYVYEGKIPHLTFNDILSFPDVGLDEKNRYYNNNDENHITPYEFSQILQQLYDNNYVLINTKTISDSINNSDELQIYLPLNKKPIILSLQHFNHDDNPAVFSDKIIIDRNKKIASYTSKKSINDRVSYDIDFITILEEFIERNNDFSFNNARAILFFNAYEGTLGYKMQRNNVSFKQEAKKILKILKTISVLGYEYGFNGYNEIQNTQKSDNDFIKDMAKWKKDIEHLFDKCKIFLASYENKNIFLNNSEKLDYVVDNDFDFIMTENKTHDLKLKNNIIYKPDNNNGYFLGNMQKVSGKTLRENPKDFKELFDPIKVYDNDYRKIALYY